MLVAPVLVALALAPADAPHALRDLRQVQRQAIPAPILLGGKRPLGVPPPTMPGVRPTGAVGGPADENVLKTARLATTDEALLDFFRKRTPPAPPRERLVELIKKLSDKDAAVRDSAQGELTALGEAAVPLLRTAANNIDDIEGSSRARLALANIEGASGASIVTNTARLLAARRPAGAAEALIGYLPYAEDDQTFQEVEAALVAVAIRDGKPDAALLKALTDKVPLRRGTAAQVICQASGTTHHAAIRPLLKDARASVRLRAALGLVGAYDADSIPVLIDVLGEPTPKLSNEAEEYLSKLAGEWAVSGPKGTDQMARRLRRDVWAAWWKNTDGGKLLDEFSMRTTSDDELSKAMSLMARLNDPKPEGREKAVADLIAAGPASVSLLRRAVNDGTPAAPLAARVLDAIEKDAPGPLPPAAARLLALRKPQGTVETLLAYLPYCESTDAADQFVDILAAVAASNGKAHEAIVKALDDKIPIRRSSAAQALCRGRAVDQIPAVRKLLNDSDLHVKLRTAQSLAALGEKAAIPTLIGLLKDLPLDEVWDVEDYLSQVAGDKTPNDVVSADPASRTKAMASWNKWWKENADKADLTGIESSRRDAGIYLLVENWNPMFGQGRVLESDGSGKVRWEIRNLQWPNDAQVLRNGNVLIVEQQNRVTERDKTGKIVGFDKYYSSVFFAERLRDGTTFLGCRNNLFIIDAKGNVTFNHAYTSNSILAAKRFRDGSMAYVSYGGQYVRLDKAGKELKNFQIPNWNMHSPNGAEILPGDRVVMASSMNKLVEFGADGKMTWETTINMPMIPYALSNGNILVSGDNNATIFEVRKGKVVKEWKGFTFRPYRVTRR